MTEVGAFGRARFAVGAIEDHDTLIMKGWHMV